MNTFWFFVSKWGKRKVGCYPRVDTPTVCELSLDQLTVLMDKEEAKSLMLALRRCIERGNKPGEGE